MNRASFIKSLFPASALALLGFAPRPNASQELELIFAEYDWRTLRAKGEHCLHIGRDPYEVFTEMRERCLRATK